MYGVEDIFIEIECREQLLYKNKHYIWNCWLITFQKYKQYTLDTDYSLKQAHEICARGQIPYGIVPRVPSTRRNGLWHDVMTLAPQLHLSFGVIQSH